MLTKDDQLCYTRTNTIFLQANYEWFKLNPNKRLTKKNIGLRLKGTNPRITLYPKFIYQTFSDFFVVDEYKNETCIYITNPYENTSRTALVLLMKHLLDEYPKYIEDFTMDISNFTKKSYKELSSKLSSFYKHENIDELLTILIEDDIDYRRQYSILMTTQRK